MFSELSPNLSSEKGIIGCGLVKLYSGLCHSIIVRIKEDNKRINKNKSKQFRVLRSVFYFLNPRGKGGDSPEDT